VWEIIRPEEQLNEYFKQRDGRKERRRGIGRGIERENFRDGRKSMDNLYLFIFFYTYFIELI
jgi:hypothetical protein